MVFDTLKEAYAIAKQKRKTKKLADAKRAIAKAFNDLYTYRVEYVKGLPRMTEGTAMYNLFPKGGFAWMCPECNKIHHPTSCSAMTGLQYPACCDHPATRLAGPGQPPVV
jgi:hypothetical protein